MTAAMIDATLVHVTVPGVPVPQGSKRAMLHKRSQRVVMFDAKSDRLAAYRADLIEHTTRALPAGHTPFDGPVVVTVVFTMPRPKAHYRTGRNAHLLRDNAPALPQGAPDIDKLSRAVLDAMSLAKVWTDDARVSTLIASKQYAPADQAPATEIWVTSATPDGRCVWVP